jgi:arginyl-tRNA synthetase
LNLESILIASTMKAIHIYLWGKCSSGRFRKGFSKKRPDGSVWIDLTDEGLTVKSSAFWLELQFIWHKISVRPFSVKDYQRSAEWCTLLVNEQDYHFKVLFLILKKLGLIENLSFIVRNGRFLPEKWKEGTVVDADWFVTKWQILQKIAEDLGSE